MPKSATFDNDLLKLIFNGTGISGLADNTVNAPNTNLYLALHTADPGVNGTQSTSEVTYTGYARAAVARTPSGFTISGNTVTPTVTINFPTGTGGGGVATFVSIGTASTGSGKILYSGALSPSVTCGNGITPQITSASTLTEN